MAYLASYLLKEDFSSFQSTPNTLSTCNVPHKLKGWPEYRISNSTGQSELRASRSSDQKVLKWYEFPQSRVRLCILSTVLLKRLRVVQIVKNLHAFNETWMFLIVFSISCRWICSEPDKSNPKPGNIFS